MISAASNDPSVATLDRLKVTAARANRISIDSYQSLQDFARSLPAPAVEGQQEAQADVERAWFFAAISREVAGLTVRISDELMFLCSMTIGSGIIRGDLRQKLVKALDSYRPLPGQPVDLRQQRLRRLPIDEALNHIMNNLDLMCSQVDALIGALSAPEQEIAQTSTV